MDFGGEMRMTFNGNPLTMRGDFKTQPSNVSAEAITNSDNSTSRAWKAKGYMAECKFEDTAVGTATAQDWEGIVRGGPYNLLVVESQTGVLHTWTNAKFVGDPEVDRNTGEVSGLKIHADTYKRTAA